MDRIYKYNSDTSYKPNGGTYLQLITAKDLYIQNVTVAEHDGGHSDSFQVKFPNVFTNYPLGTVRIEDQKFKDWDHYKFTIWQSQLNFVVFCASSACGVSIEHLNAKEPMIRSIYRFHVYYHIRRILNILEIPLPYQNSFNQYNNPYNHEKFIGICSEYGVSNNLTKWRNQKYFSTWQSRAWETGKPGMSYINENSFSRWIKGVLLIFTQERSATKFARDTEEFYNPKITKVEVTVEGVPNELYAQNMEYRHQYDEIVKNFAEGRLKEAGAIQKDLQLHNVDIASYYTDKYALWLDFRTIDDNRLHGSGRRLENTSEGIRLQITKKAESAGKLSCYLYIFQDAQINISDAQLLNVVY